MTDEKLSLKPIKYLLFTVPLAMAAGCYAGNEIATQEVAQHRTETLEKNTAQDKLVVVKKDVPPDTVISTDMLELHQAFANRIEPNLVRSFDLVVGKKTKFGLNKGQVVVTDDLK